MKIQDIKKGDLLFLIDSNEICIVLEELKSDNFSSDESLYAPLFYFNGRKNFVKKAFIGRRNQNINKWKLLCG